MIKIEITPIHMEFERMVKHRECFISLHDNRLEYYLDYDAEHPVSKDDEMMGWKEAELCKFRCSARKSDVVAIEKKMCKWHNQWNINISVSGLADDLDIYFKNDQENLADDMYEKIHNWMFNVDALPK